MSIYFKHLVRSLVPQSAAASPEQVKNSAGGYTFALEPFALLSRFLILGTDAGSYYASERALTIENAKVVDACLALDAARTVALTVEISLSGRAPKNDPAIVALAIAASHADPVIAKMALDQLEQVCRTATHLFTFVTLVHGRRGWGRGLKRAVGRWYTGKSASELAYQLTKYQARSKMSHRDVLRLAHPVAVNPASHAVLRWAASPRAATTSDANVLGERVVTRKGAAVAKIYPAVDASQLPRVIEGFEKVRDSNLSAAQVSALVREYDLTHEMVPSEHLVHPAVWEALLARMPMQAMLRNLARMTSNGLLTKNGDAARLVIDRLRDGARLTKARVHPLSILVAQRTYASGHGLKGSLTWDPLARIVDALDDAFDASFGHLVPSNKPTLLSLDVSGSMGLGKVAGCPLTPREAAAAMAMVTARTEPEYEIMAFGSSFVPLNISASMRLSDVVSKMGSLGMSGTDCALPMIWAQKHRRMFDVFAVYTDNETWFGAVHPHEALVQYRKTTGRASKLVVVGLVSSKFTIAKPDDPSMLDVVGFDTAAPQVIADFAKH
jgi:60 kDa SS-A/Ro ribonucleoprotein